MTNTINFATDNLFNELFNDNPQKLQGYHTETEAGFIFTGDYRTGEFISPANLAIINHSDDYIHCDERPTHIRVATYEIYQDTVTFKYSRKFVDEKIIAIA